MDGRAAIEWNRLALKRIVAALVAVAGLDIDHETPAEGTTRPTLPRHLWLAILRLLRPAEAAARRLIIAAARGITVTLPPPRKRKTKPVPAEQFLRRLGIAVTMPAAEIARAATAGKAATAARPRSYCLPLLDPLRTPEPYEERCRTVPAHAAPRIMLPGIIEPYRLPSPPSPGDPVSAVRLNQRLAALAAALDDLPGQARRFARWKARRDARLTRRVSPLRPGRPSGGRLSRFDPVACGRSGGEGRKAPRTIREVDGILAHSHALALEALKRPDTS
ncbi:hypothetical protein NYR54_13085 [Chelativorans sp. SCAU2101]|uniref:Uncharacterized protein n=1 Tax=Chelativorans petroleitrophicus TaxID=2975484 RepID=A0A9X2XAP6_9HYPH|nr:hypothetical protein [Chelativorans petroleitrophicus]MCT8991214.1 hypothetical protein [Chelativorans petroleitrophicus]